MKFEKLPIAPEIVENLKTHGYFRTTDIQFKAIPAILNQEDVLAIAQTGTGKTAAFAIPIISRIHDRNEKSRPKGIQCLVLVPTRELAQQIGRVFEQISAGTRAKSFAVHGGTEKDPQIARLASELDILIATPGRMFDLIRNKHIDISSARHLVVDEADKMMDDGFIKDILSVKKLLKQKHQTLFFSATINKQIKKTAYDLIRQSALRIQVSPEKLVSKNVTHYIVRVEMDDKRHLLVNIRKRYADAKIIVFVRTQVRAERVTAHLTKNNISVVALHGGMNQADRDSSLMRLRDEKTMILVTTDLSARGIDLPGINLVVNYDLPDDPENYVHRIGRTGRGFNKGDAFSFVSPEEREKLAAIEELTKTKITEMQIDLSIPVATDDEIEAMDISAMVEFEEAQYQSKRKKRR